MPQPIRRLLLGRPLHSGDASHQRLPKIIALPVFSSDALSSVAYATQQTMQALVLAGTAAFSFTMGISGVIVGLLIILTISYNQTIKAYPSGGGAYIVARENLGVLASQIAAVALLTDYILTVAVSVSSGIDAVLSAYPVYNHLSDRLALNVCATLFIMLMNLRGVKESGAVFALPTYAFVFSILTMSGLGAWQFYHHHFEHIAAMQPHLFRATENLTIFLLLTAFANGCTALTGVEAISNGIPAFRPPEAHNAAVTMRWMAGILGAMFIGISFLAQRLSMPPYNAIDPNASETVPSQIAHAVVGHGFFYFFIQWATFAVLVLAANTSFADFPRLSAIAARDRNLPRWFGALGDRLVFQNGIIVLAAVAIFLELAFKGDTSLLIPLYAIGVFVAFTLSQAGMVVKWRCEKTSGWKWRASINGLGAAMTGLVAIIFAVVKFREGAWVVLLIMPLLVVLLTRIDRHYRFVRRRLSLLRYRPPRHSRLNTALVLIERLDEADRKAVEYARVTCSDIRALYLEHSPSEMARVRAEWEAFAPDIPLILAEERWGGWVGALMDELYNLRSQDRTRVYTVVLPGDSKQGKPTGRSRRRSWLVKWTLLHEPGVVVADTSGLTIGQRANNGHSMNGAFSQVRLPGSSAASETTRRPTVLARTAVSGSAPGPGAGTLVAPDSRPPDDGTSTALVPGQPKENTLRRDHHIVLVLVAGLHRGVIEAIAYARQLGRDIRALHIEVEHDTTAELRAHWEDWAADIPLIIIESPYRQLREPLIRYIEVTGQQKGTDVLTVVVPEFVAGRAWDQVLHNQSGLLLKFAIEGQPDVVLVNTRYFLDR